MEVGGTLPIRSIRWPGFTHGPWQHLAADALTATVAAAAGLLLLRCLAGALLAPLPTFVLILVAAVFCASAIATVFLRSRNPLQSDSASWRPRHWLLGASLPAIAISLSPPESSAFGLVVMWLAIVGTEWVLWKPDFLLPARGGENAVAEAASPPSSWLPQSPDGQLAAENDSDPGVTQTLKYQQVDGALSVDGWLRVEFAAGQRTAVAHVAFCPAFLRVPAVEAEFEEGPACEIRSSFVIPWGVKWDVKLDEATTEPTAVRFAFQAIECESVATTS